MRKDNLKLVGRRKTQFFMKKSPIKSIGYNRENHEKSLGLGYVQPNLCENEGKR